MESDDLQQAIAMVRARDKRGARKILARLVRLDQKNETAWLWLGACVEEEDRERYCLEKALQINPENQKTRSALEKLATTPKLPLEQLGDQPVIEQATIEPPLYEADTLQQAIAGAKIAEQDYASFEPSTTIGKENAGFKPKGIGQSIEVDALTEQVDVTFEPSVPPDKEVDIYPQAREEERDTKLEELPDDRYSMVSKPQKPVSKIEKSGVIVVIILLSAILGSIIRFIRWVLNPKS